MNKWWKANSREISIYGGCMTVGGLLIALCSFESTPAMVFGIGLTIAGAINGLHAAILELSDPIAKRISEYLIANPERLHHDQDQNKYQ